MPLGVMLVERSALVRSGLRRILEGEADIIVVAEASNTGEAVAALTRTDVDVVVVSSIADREAIQTSAIASLRRAANIKIICVSHWADSRGVNDVLGAGASGCVEMFDATEADLKTAVYLVARGERYLSPGLTNGVVSDSGWEADYERLTAREKEILVLIAHSKSNREIARELNLSANTIAVHRNHIMKKIGVRKATALALYAAKRGLLVGK